MDEQQKKIARPATPPPEPAVEEKNEEEGSEIECGCCFMDTNIDKMVQCEDGHLFCADCARRASENQIGLRRTDLKCISSDGCKYGFSTAEAKKFLTPPVFEGWQRLCQEEDIREVRSILPFFCLSSFICFVIPNEFDKY